MTTVIGTSNNTADISREERDEYLAEFSNRVNQIENRPVKNLYIQLEAIQALELGALFLMIKTQTEYKYIFDRLDKFARLLTNDVASVFPALGFSNEQITEYIMQHRHEVCVAAPMYEVYLRNSDLEGLVEYSRYTTKEPPDLTIYFSCKYFDLDPVTKLKWLMWAKDTFSGTITVKFFKGDIVDLPKGFLTNQDFMLINNMPDFVKHPDIVKGTKEESLWPRRLWGMRQVDPTIIDTSRDNLDECIEYTELELSTLFKYHSFTRKIIRGGTNE